MEFTQYTLHIDLTNKIDRLIVSLLGNLSSHVQESSESITMLDIPH